MSRARVGSPEGGGSPEGAGSATQVPANRVQKNKPGQLVFLVPAAGPTFLRGTYFLEVRARLQGGLQIRSGRLDDTLTVV